MAGMRQSWWSLLILFSLLILTTEYEVREDEWEELSPDIAALHRLRGLSEHLQRERPHKPSSSRAVRSVSGGTSVQEADGGPTTQADIYQNTMTFLDGLQDCGNFTALVIKKEKDFDLILEDIDEQKTDDWLLTASEISHSYSQKILVMTDGEKSTNDRVQQEYSTDPYYSVIVSKECLLNDSCVPEADSYTVVKMFGSVSDDGQTVSGLSGSSLAKMVLKPSLAAAPVFSLDGNTTTEFHHSFIRVLMVHRQRAVLETTKENQQVYQVMDQSESVSSYQIPQRPVDHSTQYDHQQILIMEDNPVVKKAATNLYNKHPDVSSVYVLDENQRPKLIRGESVPLSEDSRLVLVGHGVRDDSGEMRLAGYRSQDVSKIIQRTYRVGDQIKTTSVVACKVGSDKQFIETLLKDLHETAGIETELRLRDAVLQVSHTGEKITQEITPEGLQWRHKDDSKKVVATLDRNGNVIIRNEPGRTGEAFFTNERNVLMLPALVRPVQPRRFLNLAVFNRFSPTERQQLIHTTDTLQAFAWGFFDPEPLRAQLNRVIIPQNAREYVLRVQQTADIRGFEIRSGEDIRNIIHHYAVNREIEYPYLMVNGWIYKVDPRSLYVYPVGRRLDNNQVGNNNIIDQVTQSVEEQEGKEKYPDMRDSILDQRIIANPRETHVQSVITTSGLQGRDALKQSYIEYVRNTFLGEHTTGLTLSTEAWYTTYMIASVISESARNSRTFPLTLMALDMIRNPDNNIRQIGRDFFFEGHPMARGRSWIDPSSRGITGSATPEGSSKLRNKNPRYRRTEEQLMKDLLMVVELETDVTTKWARTLGSDSELKRMSELSVQYKIYKENSEREMSFFKYFTEFQEMTEQQSNILPPSEGGGEHPASGTLGGYEDGSITTRDLNSASDLENSFKSESYFSRTSAAFAEEIHVQLTVKFGERLAGLRLKGAWIENGQFVGQFVSQDPDAEPVEFRAALSPESQRYREKLLENMDSAAHEMEVQSSTSSRQVSKYVEHVGTAVGTLGLLMGMKGAVRAFEHGDIKDGVVGALQTAHGVTAMTASIIARQALSSETRLARAVMRSPAMKGTMKVIPIVGIGFGVYNFEQDLERGGALGYTDAVLDAGMIGLDVIELAQPELAPFIIPINLAVSVVRMAIDDVYMGVQDELNSLPDDAGVWEKVGAVFVGFGKGLLHFGIHVASVFYDWGYDEIEEGRKLVAQISDYHQYYKVTKEQDGTTAIDFTGGTSSWNGGSIYFCLAEQGLSEFCMDNFVSSDESFGRKCWDVDTHGSKDIILGLGESHQLEYQTIKKKLLMFIPVGSVTVVSGYKPLSYSRYGTYVGNQDSNRFFAVQTSEDQHGRDVMLSYYYKLNGKPGDDTFFLGPQKSYVEGSGGKDTYIIPENGGETIINNYDPSKALDTLHFSVDYSRISVSKSGYDVLLRYEGSHSVTIQNWFLGEAYRHMNLMSGDGVLFEISPVVASSVKLVARAINKMFLRHGDTVDTSGPLLRTVTSIFGSRYDDVVTGNGEKNVIDGGGGRDRLRGGEGEDMYLVKARKESSVMIENDSTDNKTDVAIIEADLHAFSVTVEGDDAHLEALSDDTAIHVTLVNWFRSAADRHLVVVTKDLVTFTISDNKADCQQSEPLTKCIRSHSIDYSSSPSALTVDLQEDEALGSVTEVRGSPFDDVIKGNKEHNVFITGKGQDFIEGRGGEDWYVITPGQGTKTINNQSPDLVLDLLFLREQYQHITCTCDGQNIIMSVRGSRTVILQNWFSSKKYQHLQVQTSDGVTAALTANTSSCDEAVMLPLTIDYRNQEPEPLQTRTQRRSLTVGQPGCYSYQSRHSEETFCGLRGKVMKMDEAASVKDMYGSKGFDIMVGNSNENLLDPYTGGALMSGGEGKDTYVIKHGYGSNLLIDNFADDQSIDTVLVDMDFLDGSQVTLDSSSTQDLNVTIKTKEEDLTLSLLGFKKGYKHQHLEFLSSDGVHFKLKPLNSSGDVLLFQTEAFKVTMQQSQQMDCRLDFSSLRNLSKVQTAQGCPSHPNDILGNSQDNALFGGWKDDTLDGGEGDDTLIGGSGADLLIGGLGDDTLYGEDGDDTLMGNSGWDVFIPGPGADLVDGGQGRDTVVYRGDHEKGKGVYVNLLTGQGRYADAEGDVLKDVETVIGTIYSDILVSGYESSLLKGSDGNDILVSTGGDYLVGGEGNDIYMIVFLQGSVAIDNCAKDNGTDVLYLGSGSKLAFDCKFDSERVILTFFGPDQEAVRVSLEGWISDGNKCGHLMLVFRDIKVSMDELLQECRSRQAEESLLLSHQLKHMPGSCQQFVHVTDLWSTEVCAATN